MAKAKVRVKTQNMEYGSLISEKEQKEKFLKEAVRAGFNLTQAKFLQKVCFEV